MDAERKLRLERFDLVVIDLMLPDSTDEDATVTRIASMGKFRVAVVSGSDKRDDVVKSLINAGVDCSPKAVGKEDLPLADFVRRPELFRDFVHSLMPDAGPPLKTATR
jgi:DNA-binding response OmpR family regulator